MNSKYLLLVIGLIALVLVSGCTTQISETELQEPILVEVTVMLADGTELVNEDVMVEEGETAYDALTKLVTVEAEEYSIGKFITTIEGVNPEADEYWAFYIDGEYAQVGPDGFAIEDEVELLFKIEKLE